MLINELPDDCLLAIFGYMNNLDDLINCYKVCSKWSYLIPERTKKVKYFIEHPDYLGYPVYPLEYVYCQGEKPIYGSCLIKLFSNLIIADISYGFRQKVNFEDIVALVRNQESLKGLIDYNGLYYDLSESLTKYCNKLEMISSDYIGPSIQQNGSSVKQLNLWNYTLDGFKRDAHCFPNLERLHIYNNEGSPDTYYDGPILEKLKIVELSLSSYDGTDIYYGFQFMDSCPNLQSAHIIVDSDRLFVDESLKHKCLQDLVISFLYSERIDWNELSRLFMKYHNLKHLSLRHNSNIKDAHIEQLVRILPNLVLLDVRGCDGVTQRAADYVQDYCKRYGRLIKFYFTGNPDEIESDWPQLSTEQEKICRGFDFMKHCFFKGFHQLPCFLIPIDY